MIGDWLSENYIDNLSPTSDNHPFSGWFSMVDKWLLMIAEQFWSARGFRCSINNHRQPNKAAIQNEYTFDPEKRRWWRNRGRVVLNWSATGRRLVVGADLHNQLYHPHFKRNSNMYSWNCPRMVVKMYRNFFWRQGDSKDYANHVTPNSRRPIGDYSPNGCWSSSKMWSMFDNQSASNWQLVVDHSATGRQTVGDRSANSRRPIED